jgi:hypothetical protein
LRFLHFSRVFAGDLPEKDRFSLYLRPFYLDYSAFNFKVAEVANYLYAESFFFKGFRIWSFKNGDYVWLSLVSKMYYKDYMPAYRPYNLKVVDLSSRLHRVYLRQKAFLYEILVACCDGF